MSGEPQTVAAIRESIHAEVGDHYPLLGLLVDLEAAVRAESIAQERERLAAAGLDRVVADAADLGVVGARTILAILQGADR